VQVPAATSLSQARCSGRLCLGKEPGGSGDDEPRDITVDSSGNVYTTGYGTADFDPGAGVTSPVQGSFDIFISKLNPNGLCLGKNLGAVVPTDQRHHC